MEATRELAAQGRPLDPADPPSMADELLDDLIPPDLDWRGIVRRHPVPSLLVAAAVGYWLGRGRRGSALADALTGAAAASVVARVGGLVGGFDGDDFDSIGGLDDEPYGV